MPFAKGKSGNPGGRPKDTDEIKKLAQSHCRQAIERLAEWMASDNPKASVGAAIALLDRGYGKATQPLSGEGGTPLIPAALNISFVKPDAAGSDA